MKDPKLAFDHFSRILTRADSPYAKARAGYWGVPAAEIEAKSALAAKWYAAGAEHMATFYGQLAAHQLGNDAPPHPVPEPIPDAAELARFEANELVRAEHVLIASNRRTWPLQQDFPVAARRKRYHADAVRDGRRISPKRDGRVDLSIAVASRAIMAGTPLMIHGYPTTALPERRQQPSRPWCLRSCARRAPSRPVRSAGSGALGLMQLMPATASFIAGKSPNCHSRPCS